MTDFLGKIYDWLVLERPGITLVALFSVLGFFAYHTPNFKLDASADALLLESDRDLQIFRQVNERYESRDFLFVTFTPDSELFADGPLNTIASLRDELLSLAGVDSVVSLLDVPLVKIAGGTLSEVARNYQTLETPGVDRLAAKEELRASPIFRELILSLDGQTTALQVFLNGDPRIGELRKQRNALIQQSHNGDLDVAGQERLQQVLAEYNEAKTQDARHSHELIAEVRAVMGKHAAAGQLHLGGVSMITDDMITFIRNDLIVFGGGVLLFLVIMLSTIFRKIRWVVLPLASCIFAGLLMIGLLGLAGWRVTVISSNFISLMLIITMSMNVHLVVRYRQLNFDNPDWDQLRLVRETTGRMVRPCFYTALTTILAFASLVVSGIKPVIDFGWMMTIGLAVTFLTSFLLFPALLMSLKRREENPPQSEALLTARLAGITERHGAMVLVVSLVLALLGGWGVSKLEVENSFTNYFSESTEIYQGLKLIDDKLGGTMPLDIILKFNFGGEQEADSEGDDDFDDLFGAIEVDPSDEWFTGERVGQIERVHDYIESLPAVGKVLSLSSVLRVAEELNQGEEFDTFQLAVVYKRLPEDLRKSLLEPYIDIDNDEARVTLRIKDSLKDLRRKALLEKIQTDLNELMAGTPTEVQVTGLLVLYNNMLQSLFQSQIMTLGVVMAGIAGMLLILFRSVSLAIIGIIPNLLAAAVILGLMGWLRIPLDMMTITIAAITVGIAVDNSIHYIYRFREELPKTGDYLKTLHYCHANIGRAVFYTATVIVVGFSILVFSNFIPTIYFGLLTALAMLMALLAALTLLPKLIVMWKPF
jgi:predicted RND superfamily exporter protein